MSLNRSGKPLILVTGASGQLGSELRVLAQEHAGLEFDFLSRDELPLHDFPALSGRIRRSGAAYCINCAAYTAVDRAESDAETAFLVNGEAVGVIAAACGSSGIKFCQISTDYVFDGQGSRPYKEEDATGPVNVYGASKLLGETKALDANRESIVIRTSWLYSTFGSNFLKTMMRLFKEKDQIAVVYDQYGSPTYAADLAGMLLSVVQSGKWIPGIYHYSNEGMASWYEFALSIKEILGVSCEIFPVRSAAYATAARRPAYSVMDKTKIRTVYGTHIPHWKSSVDRCLRKLTV